MENCRSRKCLEKAELVVIITIGNKSNKSYLCKNCWDTKRTEINATAKKAKVAVLVMTLNEYEIWKVLES